LISIPNYLELDVRGAVDATTTYIKELLHTREAQGIVMGLSGGIDSAVLATLATRAVGKERVYARYIYDRDNAEASHTKAESMASTLGIDLKSKNMEPLLQAKEIYTPIAMQITRASPLLNRLFHYAYHLLTGETPFMTSLREGGGNFEKESFKHKVYKFTCDIP
jgi:NAD+ synthase